MRKALTHYQALSCSSVRSDHMLWEHEQTILCDTIEQCLVSCSKQHSIDVLFSPGPMHKAAN